MTAPRAPAKAPPPASRPKNGTSGPNPLPGSYNPGPACRPGSKRSPPRPRRGDGGLIATRRDLHQHPELGFERTGPPASWPRRLDAWVSPPAGESGARAWSPISRPPFPASCFAPTWTRCPSRRRAVAPYASEEPGRMHACGHDGHVAIALALAARLARRADPGRFRFLFQPAEEGAGGAQACAADGVLDGVDAGVRAPPLEPAARRKDRRQPRRADGGRGRVLDRRRGARAATAPRRTRRPTRSSARRASSTLSRPSSRGRSRRSTPSSSRSGASTAAPPSTSSRPSSG